MSSSMSMPKQQPQPPQQQQQQQQQQKHVWVRHGSERPAARIVLPPAAGAAVRKNKNGGSGETQEGASSGLLLEVLGGDGDADDDLVYVQYATNSRVKEFVPKDRVEPMLLAWDGDDDGGGGGDRPQQEAAAAAAAGTRQSRRVRERATMTTTTTTTTATMHRESTAAAAAAAATTNNNNDDTRSTSLAAAVAEAATKRRKTAAEHWHVPQHGAARRISIQRVGGTDDQNRPFSNSYAAAAAATTTAAASSSLTLRLPLLEGSAAMMVSSSGSTMSSLSSSSPPQQHQEAVIVVDANADAANNITSTAFVGQRQKYPIGTQVEKYFNITDDDPAVITARLFQGWVVRYEAATRWYWICYEDGDEEELEEGALTELLATSAARHIPCVAPDCAVSVTSCVFDLHGLDVSFATSQLTELFHGQPHSCCRTVAEFFLFVSERQRMYERRRRADTPPWSAGPAFCNYAWCNVYRELDRGTAFFREHILNILDDEMMKAEQGMMPFWGFVRRVLFCSFLYRQVNRIETFLQAGFPNEDNLEPFFATLEQMSAQGEKVFSGAHQTTNLAMLKKRINEETRINSATGENRLDAVCDKILQVGNDKRTIVLALRQLQGVGAFTSWQILCDLQECHCIMVDDEKDGFCLLGPGAENGVQEIFPTSSRPKLELVQELVQKHEQVYQKLGVQFPYWRGRLLTIKEIEHALCEFAKFKSIHNKTNSGRAFRSRASLDVNKPCFTCHQLKKCSTNGVLLCDMCQVCFCLDCVRAPMQDAVSWICHRCKALEQLDVFYNSF